MQRKNFYAMALDRDKKKLEVVASNPGHLLFSRALKADRARAVANRLMQPDMNSGWGWRTMSADEKVFNPLSYHRGSVWPHDNSLIAHGMALYDFRRPALQILTQLFQARTDVPRSSPSRTFLRSATARVRCACALSCLMFAAGMGVRRHHS